MTQKDIRHKRAARLRRVAEAMAREEGLAAETIAALSPAEIHTTLHESRVQQIQLEMQNEELRRMHAELEATRARYFDLYDLAPVGYLTLSDTGLILEANLTAATLLGASREMLLKRSLSQFIVKEDQDAFYLYRNQGADGSGPHACDLRIVQPDGRVFWAHLVASVMAQTVGSLTYRVVLSDITEQKQVEHALREQHALFAAIFEESPDVLAVQNTDHTIKYFNAAGYQLLGLTQDEVKGKKCYELIGRASECEECASTRALISKKSEHLEKYIPELQRYMDCRSYPILDGDHNVVYLIEQVRDITERRRMEEAVRESEERYRFLFDSSADAKFLIATDSKQIIQANRRAAVMYGYDPEELLTKTSIDLSAEPEKTRRLFEEAQAIPDLVINVPQRRHRKKDGTVFPVEITGRSLLLQGRPVILLAVRDISKRQAAEAALRESENRRLREQKSANAQLREHSDYLVSIYQALDSVGLIVCDLVEGDARIRIFNSGAEKLFGYCRDEAIGQSIALIYPPELVEFIPGRTQRFSEGRALQSFNMTLVRQSGERFPAIVSVHPFDWHEGRCRKAVGVFRDISELMAIQQQLETMNEDLERRVEQRTRELQETQKQYLHAEKLSAIGKLSASIAHEFNNPLQGILSILKGLRKRAILEEEDRALLEAAIGESDRIKELIRGLQEFNRPSSGRIMPMDVHAALDSMLLLHKSDFKGKRITVERNYAERLPQICAVPDQIKQVFLNLLTNAADACRQPGGMITVSTRQEDSRVAISIKDSGIGIKPEEMALIFQPFYTTKPEVKGTGLGLSVSYGIVESHGGEIRVESRPGEGATFTVVLPIKAADGAAGAVDR